MCGIVGYVGPDQAVPVIVEGLTQLEYRGYDSAGLGVLTARGPKIVRAVGRVRDLEAKLPKRLSSTIGIGHTRWATHGPATQANAHPHQSDDGRILLVHNGIIDNAAQLRARLVAEGIEFASDTDTEALAHLIARSQASTLEEQVLDALSQVSGTFAIAVVDSTQADRIVVARRGSPLVLGVGDHEMLVASDPAAIVRHTSSVVHLDDGECAVVTADSFRTFTAESSDTGKQPQTVDAEAIAAEIGEHASFMHKEMFEQPESLRRMLSGRLDHRFATVRLDGLGLDPRDLRSFKRVKAIGCGSAYYIGQLGASLIEDLARIPADAEPASEFRYRNPIIEPDTLYVAVSQSGETADTLFAVQEIQRKGGHVVGLVNVVGSSIARACGGGIYLHAGPEVSVASTKVLTHMGVGCAMLAVLLGRVRDLSHSDGARILAGLERIPDQVREILDREAEIGAVADVVADATSVFFIGRVRGYPVAREGAQKLKEISYLHAEAYPSSELKHGPLALISAEMPTVAIVPDDELVDRNIGALHEVSARQGPLVVVTHEAVEIDVEVARIDVPKNERELDPLLMTVPLQLLAHQVATRLGRDIDRPRNLAKSVTVE